LRRLGVNYFTVLYDLLRPVVTQRDDSDAACDVDVECAIIECLYNAWPADADTQKKHLVEMVQFLAGTVENTTRKNQVCSRVARFF
jgi:hypothetical protein